MVLVIQTNLPSNYFKWEGMTLIQPWRRGQKGDFQGRTNEEQAGEWGGGWSGGGAWAVGRPCRMGREGREVTWGHRTSVLFGLMFGPHPEAMGTTGMYGSQESFSQMRFLGSLPWLPFGEWPGEEAAWWWRSQLRVCGNDPEERSQLSHGHDHRKK